MTTDQKYDGKADNANQINLTGGNPEQTAQNSPQTVNQDQLAATTSAVTPALLSETFDFDELVIFNGLSDAGKTTVSALVNSGKYKPETLKRALVHISKTPDTAAPSDEFNGESLQSILNETPAEPFFSVEGLRDKYAAPITVDLPYFLYWQIQDQQHAQSLIYAIERMCNEFSRSEVGKQIDEDLNQSLAYSALRRGLIELVERAAINRLGSFEKSKDYDWLHITPTLATGDPRLDEAPVLVNDPTHSFEVDHLQEWVSILQQMLRLQQKITANQKQSDTIKTELIKEQSEAIALLKQQNQAQASLLNQRDKEAAQLKHEKENKQHIPHAQSYIDLMLFVDGGYESELELVRFVLAQAAKKMLKKVFKHITLDETVEAFYANEEYNRLQKIMARLAQEAINLANDNYNKVEYERSPAFYLKQVKSGKAKEHNRRDKFVAEYSVFTIPEDEDDEEETTVEPAQPEASTQASSEAQDEQESEYLQGLSKTSKEVIRAIAAKGDLSEEELTFKVDWMFRPDNLAARAEPDYFEGLTPKEKTMLYGARFSGAPLERLKRIADGFRNDPVWIRSGFDSEAEYLTAQESTGEPQQPTE